MIQSEYYKKSLRLAHDRTIEAGRDLLNSINAVLNLEEVVLSENNYPRYETYKRQLIIRMEAFHKFLHLYSKAFYYELAVKDFAFYDNREEVGS